MNINRHKIIDNPFRIVFPHQYFCKTTMSEETKFKNDDRSRPQEFMSLMTTHTCFVP